MHKIILSVFIVLFTAASCKNDGQTNSSKTDAYTLKLDSLTTAYQDSFKAQHGGLTTEFLHKWGDRYWKLVKTQPNHERAPEVAKRAFEIYNELSREDFIKKKLKELSIHDRAMSGIIKYWNYALWRGEDYTPETHPYPQKLNAIASQSQSRNVKVAAHYYLAQWLIQFKYYDRVLNHLNTLDLTYQVYATNETYGEGIKEMRAEVDEFSAGKRLPNFKTKMLSGKTLMLADLKDRVTFLYFYGSSCGSCVSMYPKITKMYQEHKKQKFNVVGIALDWGVPYGFNNPDEFYDFATEYNIAWPQTTESHLWEKIKVQALSTGYLIDQKGKIIRISRSDTVSNAIDGFENTSLEEAVVKLLEKS